MTTSTSWIIRAPLQSQKKIAVISICVALSYSAFLTESMILLSVNFDLLN